MTTLFQRGPAEEIPRFQLNPDRVTISRRSIDSAICCVQSFVRDPLFTQRDFFTDNGILMLLSAVNVAGSVCEDCAYNPWTVTLLEGYAAVVADLKKACDVVVVRRKDARDTFEQWFGVASVESSVVGESSSKRTVRISNVVEVEGGIFVPVCFYHASFQYEFRCQKSLERGNRERVRHARQSCNQASF